MTFALLSSTSVRASGAVFALGSRARGGALSFAYSVLLGGAAVVRVALLHELLVAVVVLLPHVRRHGPLQHLGQHLDDEPRPAHASQTQLSSASTRQGAGATHPAALPHTGLLHVMNSTRMGAPCAQKIFLHGVLVWLAHDTSYSPVDVKDEQQDEQAIEDLIVRMHVHAHRPSHHLRPGKTGASVTSFGGCRR